MPPPTSPQHARSSRIAETAAARALRPAAEPSPSSCNTPYAHKAHTHTIRRPQPPTPKPPSPHHIIINHQPHSHHHDRHERQPPRPHTATQHLQSPRSSILYASQPQAPRASSPSAAAATTEASEERRRGSTRPRTTPRRPAPATPAPQRSAAAAPDIVFLECRQNKAPPKTDRQTE